MSLYRFVYYSAVIGGWTAFLAWMVAELFVLDAAWVVALARFFSLVLFLETVPVGIVQTAVVAGVVGASIATGLNVLAGVANAQWKRQKKRLPAAILGGAIGGIFGGAIGQVLYDGLGFPRALGWTIMGLAIGGTEGFFEESRSKLRNGLIGGGIGGLLGGALFEPVSHLAASGSGMAARATAFVVLGIAIGALIGLTQLVLKEAWLTVLDGFRPGRELILGQTVTLLGRGDHLPLPLLGHPGRDLEAEHAKVTRKADGSYTIEDNHSRLGTFLNAKRIEEPVILGDGDLIKLGANIVRFNLRSGKSTRRVEVPDTPIPAATAGIAPPPLPPGTPATGQAPPPPLPSPQLPPRPLPIEPQSPPPRPGSPVVNPRIPPPPPPPG